MDASPFVAEGPYLPPMFRFEHPEHLYYLLGLPLLIAFFVLVYFWRKRTWVRLGDAPLLKELAPQRATYKHRTKWVLYTLALTLLVVGWANPQWGTKTETVMQESADVILALDISESMLAEDVSPSRMERAKRFAQELVTRLRGDRIGVIIFAGNAYLQLPLTNDYSAVQLFLKSASPSMAPSQGTAIGQAIELAGRSFEATEGGNQALIVITDGENHEGEAPEQAAAAAGAGTQVYTVGVGTEQGAPIPVVFGGRRDYKRDQSGQVVQSRLNPTMLRDLATRGGGDYVALLDNTATADLLESRIERLQRREVQQRSFSEYASYFQYFLGAAFVLLLIEWLLSYRRNRLLAGRQLY